jgi:hypothetical protein
MTFNRLKRRDFIGLLGCSIIAKPMAARAQQAKPGRIGFLRVGRLRQPISVASGKDCGNKVCSKVAT